VLVFFVAIGSISLAQSEYQAGYPLPDFELPYYADTGPYWSSGPHQYGKPPKVKWMDLYSGSGLDFAYGGKSFDVAAMAEGDVVWASRVILENDLGMQVAIKHEDGGSIIRYGHLREIYQPILDAINEGRPYHVLPGYTIGYAGNTATTEVHLHIELRDGTRDCCGVRGDGGNPISWHGLVINGYRISDYRPNELGVDSEDPTREVAYNYDGLAVKVSDLSADLGPFPYENFSFNDYLGNDSEGRPIYEERTGVYTLLPSDFVCTTDPCELTKHSNVEFSGHGRLGGGSVLYSDLEAPVDQPQPETTSPAMDVDPNSTYGQALVKIQQAIDENTMALGLIDMGLTELPPEIGNLTNLNALWLQGNDLTSLPPEIAELKNLTILSVEDNLLTVFPQEILSLTNLKQLYLSGNYLVAIPSEIGSLSNLEILMLNRNQLTSFPPELDGFFDSLNMLRLDTNPKTEIPAEIVAQGTQAVLEYIYSQPPFVQVSGDLSYSITTFPATSSVDITYSIEFEAELRPRRSELSVAPDEELIWSVDGNTIMFTVSGGRWKNGVSYTAHVYTESLDGRIFDSDINLGVINP